MYARREEESPLPGWLRDAVDLDAVETNNIIVHRSLPHDTLASADEEYHDREAARYDSYLVEEPVQSAEAWIVPLIADLLGSGLIVDLGCGTGRIARSLVERGCRVIGVDRSRRMLEAAAGNIRDGNFVPLRADCRSLPLRSESCDGAVCSGVLHHVLQWQRVLHEAARILRPGGRLIVREPNVDYVEALFTPLERLVDWLADGGVRGVSVDRDGSCAGAGGHCSAEDAPYERDLSISELRAAAAAARLRIEMSSSTMLLGSLGLPEGVPLRATYYRLANRIDHLLLRHGVHHRRGALLLAVMTRE